LSKEKGDVKFDHNMSSELKNEVQQKLRDAGLKLVNYGVVDLPNNDTECRKVFNFAKEMGIETIVSEPPEDAFDLVEKLCEEYKINVAIHNHPKPSHYWNPDTVLKVCQGRSSRIGACADTGHWMRFGVNPVEAIKKLKGRIISLHFKDLNEFDNPKAHDVVWGTGAANTSAILAELSSQNFKGVFSIEYEYNWLNSVPEIAECVSYFEQRASEIGQTDLKCLFNGKDLGNFQVKGDKEKSKWVVGTAKVSADNPALLVNDGGHGDMINLASKHGDSIDIYTKEKFGDCRIELELMVPKGSNSGIYVMGEYEIQVLDSFGKEKLDQGDMGAIYGAAPPSVNACKKPGEWQKYVIEFRVPRFDADGKKTENAKFVKIELNGQVLHENLEMTGPTPGGVTGKEAPTGPLMLQGNHGPVALRNIMLKPIK
jgi:sugar phosphate isomerase/epimerase